MTKHPSITLTKFYSHGYSDEEMQVLSEMKIEDYRYEIKLPEFIYEKIETKVRQRRYAEAQNIAKPYIVSSKHTPSIVN